MIDILAAVLLQSAAPQTGENEAPPPAARALPCETEARRAFDFWLGEWIVHAPGQDEPVGRSAISKMSGGCAVRETWMPFKQPNGTSLTMLNANTGRWEQVWIGSDGQRVEFEGGIVDGKMILTGYWNNLAGPGKHALIRMTFTRMDASTVRQFGEASTDHGLTWKPSFDFLYKRAPIPSLKEQP